MYQKLVLTVVLQFKKTYHQSIEKSTIIKKVLLHILMQIVKNGKRFYN